MRRDAFLRASAAGMLAQAFPCAGRAAATEVVEYSLTAAPLAFSPVRGASFAGLAYNGTIPGPLLRIVHGQRLRVHYRNRAATETAVHWHGMILPNAMDGAAGVTQPPVPDGGTYLYEFAPGPAGTRWYHDHTMGTGMGGPRGLFGMIVVEDPRDEPADAEFAVVLHDVPDLRSVSAALHGSSNAAMVDPPGSAEMRAMRADDRMGDEVAYLAHCINGGAYPHATPLRVRVGQHVRLRILNASPTQTRYLRLAGHRLHVTHADGNALDRPLDVDALRIGVAERYDAWFEVRGPGSWLLQSVSMDPLAFQQALVVQTPGMERAAPLGVAQTLDGIDFFTYERAAGIATNPVQPGRAHVDEHLILAGRYGSSRWTINGRTWPDTEKIAVARGDRVVLRFTNTTAMHHPMHLHGHTFRITEVNGRRLARPLAKDVALVDPHGGTLAWEFDATSPAGRWLLHCHNDVHMVDGMMTEVVYR